MLDGMRFMVEVPDEDEEPLRTLANRDVRGFKQQAGYLLHLKIQEAFACLLDSHLETDAAEIVA